MADKNNPFDDLIKRFSLVQDSEEEGMEMDEFIEQAEAEEINFSSSDNENVNDEEEAIEDNTECDQIVEISAEQFLRSNREDQYKELTRHFTPEYIKEVQEKFQHSLDYHRDEAFQEDITQNSDSLSISRKFAASTSLSAKSSNGNHQQQHYFHDPRQQNRFLSFSNPQLHIPSDISQLFNSPGSSSFNLRVREFELYVPRGNIMMPGPGLMNNIQFESGFKAPLAPAPRRREMKHSNHHLLRQLSAPPAPGSFDASSRALLPYSSLESSIDSDSRKQKKTQKQKLNASPEKSSAKSSKTTVDQKELQQSIKSQILKVSENFKGTTDTVEISSSDEEKEKEKKSKPAKTLQLESVKVKDNRVKSSSKHSSKSNSLSTQKTKEVPSKQPTNSQESQPTGKTKKNSQKSSEKHNQKDIQLKQPSSSSQNSQKSSEKPNLKESKPRAETASSSKVSQKSSQSSSSKSDTKQKPSKTITSSKNDTNLIKAVTSSKNDQKHQTKAVTSSDEDSLTLNDVSTAGSSMTTDDDDLFFSGGYQLLQERRQNHREKKYRKRKEDRKQVKGKTEKGSEIAKKHERSSSTSHDDEKKQAKPANPKKFYAICDTDSSD